MGGVWLPRSVTSAVSQPVPFPRRLRESLQGSIVYKGSQKQQKVRSREECVAGGKALAASAPLNDAVIDTHVSLTVGMGLVSYLPCGCPLTEWAGEPPKNSKCIPSRRYQQPHAMHPAVNVTY